jgi:signal transduction histidine kinase
VKEQLEPLGALAMQCYAFVQRLRSSPGEKEALNEMLRDIESHVRRVVERDVLSEINALLEDGIRSIDQISGVVLNLKDFSRLDRDMVADFSVEAGLDSALALAGSILDKARVHVVRQYGAVPRISGSPSQINQVLLNLITNAAQAMPGRARENRLTLRTALDSQEWVRIEIEDNGAGIAPEVLPRIFDPFFTTRPVGEGKGMGLSVCFQIVQAHGGRIAVKSEPGVGTLFTVLLPVASAQTGPGAVDDPGAGEMAGTHRALPAWPGK